MYLGFQGWSSHSSNTTLFANHRTCLFCPRASRWPKRNGMSISGLAKRSRSTAPSSPFMRSSWSSTPAMRPTTQSRSLPVLPSSKRRRRLSRRTNLPAVTTLNVIMLASRAPSQLVQFGRESSTSGAWEATPGSAPASARALVVRGQRQSAGAAT